jgi:hypothetical protein
VGENFGVACDQIDQADVMLAGLHQWARQDLALPKQAWPETDGPWIIVLAGREPESQTVSLILNATTAVFAITAHADEREAQVREVEQFGLKAPTAAATARPSPLAKHE